MIDIPVRDTENILFLQFRVKNLRPGHDLTVWVEGTRNKLTSNRHFYYNKNTVFTYAVPLEKGQKQIRVKFGEGHYEISGAKCFLGAPVSREEAGLCQSEFMADQEKTKGNVIAGEINVKSDGYFVTTIPYDESFDVYVDGQETGKEKVNTAFLGFQISEGEHEIRIVYQLTHWPNKWEDKSTLLFVRLFCDVKYRKRKLMLPVFFKRRFIIQNLIELTSNT